MAEHERSYRLLHAAPHRSAEFGSDRSRMAEGAVPRHLRSGLSQAPGQVRPHGRTELATDWTFVGWAEIEVRRETEKREAHTDTARLPSLLPLLPPPLPSSAAHTLFFESRPLLGGMRLPDEAQFFQLLDSFLLTTPLPSFLHAGRKPRAVVHHILTPGCFPRFCCCVLRPPFPQIGFRHHLLA